ncbi:helix-turn-helix domain-containing protein [Klebsiella pneumoniae]|uniref:helix-turn-helix domain-containing protein n=1 Tax=Klebsiella pneumoniae TaxID=573 RepID=UPI003A5CDE4B
MRAQSTLRTVCPRPSLPHVESGLAEEPVAIVQTGSFQSAARALGLAQPTVSQHLQKLEEQVGVTLVQRSRRLPAYHTGAGLHAACDRLARHARPGARSPAWQS